MTSENQCLSDHKAEVIKVSRCVRGGRVLKRFNGPEKLNWLFGDIYSVVTLFP